MSALCSGYGQYDKQPGTITWQQVLELIDNPQQVDKSQSQWLIPSTLLSRTFKEQEQCGEFHSLWSDIDKEPPPLASMIETVESITLGSDLEIYSSRSATQDCPKWHVLVPLFKPLSGADWCLAQEVLNDKLEAAGITPDRASERAAQLCYLPNRGQLYQTYSVREGRLFDAADGFSGFGSEIAAKREQQTAEAEELRQKRESAKARREALTAIGDNPDTIGAFRESYTVDAIMLQAGYDQRGSGFRHPNSESGSYSANVKDGRVHALSTADLLYSDGKGAHDSFSAFCVLFHGGDQNAALKDAGDNWLSIGGESWNKVKRREFMQAKEGASADDFADFDDFESKAVNDEQFSLAQFSLNGKSEDMRKKMLADKYVLGRIAILGQITAIYAKPNSGKTLLTLYLLIEAVKSGELDGDSVFYINADDTYKGLVYKTELAERYGFQMIAPGLQDFDSNLFLRYLQKMIDGDTASGVVVILDTLKKFTDIMDKRIASDFGKVMRAFAQAGGTLIMLAHTNKNRDTDGKVVVSGTSDIVDDADCAYTLDVKESAGDLCSVIFENIKQRGDVVREAAYSYSRRDGINYLELLASVTELDEDTKRKHKEEQQIELRLIRNAQAITAITETIEAGIHGKTELLEHASKASGIPKPKITKALDDHTGGSWKSGHRWRLERGEKNAKRYHLLTVFYSENADTSYAHAKG
jgi:hypothetical protein